MGYFSYVFFTLEVFFEILLTRKIPYFGFVGFLVSAFLLALLLVISIIDLITKEKNELICKSFNEKIKGINTFEANYINSVLYFKSMKMDELMRLLDEKDGQEVDLNEIENKIKQDKINKKNGLIRRFVKDLKNQGIDYCYKERKISPSRYISGFVYNHLLFFNQREKHISLNFCHNFTHPNLLVFDFFLFKQFTI